MAFHPPPSNMVYDFKTKKLVQAGSCNPNQFGGDTSFDKQMGPEKGSEKYPLICQTRYDPSKKGPLETKCFSMYCGGQGNIKLLPGGTTADGCYEGYYCEQPFQPPWSKNKPFGCLTCNTEKNIQKGCKCDPKKTSQCGSYKNNKMTCQRSTNGDSYCMPVKPE